MSCEPSHWNMLIMLINLPAQGNELWTQPLKYVDYANKVPAQGNELWTQQWKYVDYADKFTSSGKWAVNPAIEICWLC